MLDVNDKLKFRIARESDIEALVCLLVDDPLGAQREKLAKPLSQAYSAAFAAIDADPNNELIVATIDEDVAACLQLTYIPYLTYQGSWRAVVEGVRVAKDFRSQGVGSRMFEWAIERAKQRGCRLLQLTTDKTRLEAVKFYENLGFTASHQGMKLDLGCQYTFEN